MKEVKHKHKWEVGSIEDVFIQEIGTTNSLFTHTVVIVICPNCAEVKRKVIKK